MFQGSLDPAIAAEARRLADAAMSADRVDAEGGAAEALREPVCVDRGDVRYWLRARRYGGDAAHAAVVVTVERVSAALPTEVQLREWYGLSPREAQVALLLAERKSAREIADVLGLKPHTATRHTEAVFTKLGITRRGDVRETLRRPAGPVGGSAA